MTDVMTIAAHAAVTEERGRVAAESLAAARRLGAFSLAVPAAYGGREVGARTLADELAVLGRACPATAWIAGTGATAARMVATALPERGREEAFADPDALFCGSGKPGGTTTTAPGGIRLTGSWSTVSGCEDATWAMLMVMSAGVPTIVCVPVSALTVERTWSATGMYGTGSHSVVAGDVFVPEHRTAAFVLPPPALRLYFVLCVLAPVVGAARGALDTVTALFASDHKPGLTEYGRIAESPAARQWYAEATLLVTRAERTVHAIAAASDAGEATPAHAMDAADAARDCRAAVERMLDVHGSSGFAGGHQLQRHWRDIAVASRHRQLSPYLAIETFGKAVTGVA